MPVYIMFLIIPMIVLVPVVFVWLARVRAGRWRPRSARRHVVTRIVCGVLAVGILGAVAVTSYLDVQRSPAPADLPATVRVPTRSLGELYADMPQGKTRRPDRARLLARLIVVDVSTPLLRPMLVDEHEFHWSVGSNAKIQRRRETDDGLSVLYDVTVSDVEVVVPLDKRSPRRTMLQLRGSGTIRCRHGNHRASSGGSLQDTNADGVSRMDSSFVMRGASSRNPLSLLADPVATMNVYLVLTLELLAEDDPMETVPLTSLIDAHSRQIRLGVWRRGNREYYPAKVSRMVADPGVPGAAMVEHLGVSVVSLLAAAALLTQLFVRRRLALICLLTLMIAGAAGADRLAMGRWLARADDGDQPVKARIDACMRAGGTLFYRRTARAGLTRLAERRENPPALRHLAAELARALSPQVKAVWDMAPPRTLQFGRPGTPQWVRLDVTKFSDPATGRTVLLGIWPKTHFSMTIQRRRRLALGDGQCLLPAETDRIVILTRGLTFHAVGTREDFRRAVEAFDAGRLRESWVWQDVIAPALSAHGLQPIAPE